MLEHLKVIEIAIKLLDKKILICNSQMGMFMTDLIDFKISTENDSNIERIPADKYEIGTYNESVIYIDPLMKWDDCRILDENKNELFNLKDHFDISSAILG